MSGHPGKSRSSDGKAVRWIHRSRILGTTVLATAMISASVAGPAEAAPAPLACGDVILADTTLHTDILNCEANGLVIGADGITLNLNGHTIAGNGVFQPDRFEAGILLLDHHHVRITGPGTTTEHNAAGIATFDDQHNLVLHNTASHNDFTGIVLSGTFDRAEGNTTSDNGSDELKTCRVRHGCRMRPHVAPGTSSRSACRIPSVFSPNGRAIFVPDEPVGKGSSGEVQELDRHPLWHAACSSAILIEYLGHLGQHVVASVAADHDESIDA